jgi:hypothetical protein
MPDRLGPPQPAVLRAFADTISARSAMLGHTGMLRASTAEEPGLIVQSVALVLSMVISILTLVLLVIQTRALSAQTRSVAKNLEYGTYLKLVDSLNEINLRLMSEPAMQEMFREVGYIADGVDAEESLSISRLALAWHHFNRYEAAFLGFQRGILPDSQWTLWRRRLELDMQVPFLRAAWRVERVNYAYDPEFIACMQRAVDRYGDLPNQDPSSSTVGGATVG